MLETIYGCKWSLTVYQLLAAGINRPGEMVRSVDGLTTKVLNECLRKNTQFGILERISYNEVPPPRGIQRHRVRRQIYACSG